MVHGILDEALSALVPRGWRAAIKNKILEIAGYVVTFVAVLVEKKPALVPVLRALQWMVAADHDGHPSQHMRLVINRIQRLKLRLTTADAQGQGKIRRILEALYELLVEDGDDYSYAK